VASYTCYKFVVFSQYENYKLVTSVGRHGTAYVLGENYKLVTSVGRHGTAYVLGENYKLVTSVGRHVLLKVALNTGTLILFIEKFLVM
jgi:hypothetical protein